MIIIKAGKNQRNEGKKRKFDDNRDIQMKFMVFWKFCLFFEANH